MQSRGQQTSLPLSFPKTFKTKTSRLGNRMTESSEGAADNLTLLDRRVQIIFQDPDSTASFRNGIKPNLERLVRINFGFYFFLSLLDILLIFVCHSFL